MIKKIWPDQQNRSLFILVGVFLAAWLIPFGLPRVSGAIQESFLMLSEYARQHVLLCLVPAFFIAGAIMIFLDQQSGIQYLGPDAKKIVAYGVASVSGTILAVCSCTVLPIFKGIYKKGAGIGPAVAFLYSGPAINILAIILTAKVLGIRLGAASRAWDAIYAYKYVITAGFAVVLIYALLRWFERAELADWVRATRDFAVGKWTCTCPSSGRPVPLSAVDARHSQRTWLEKNERLRRARRWAVDRGGARIRHGFGVIPEGYMGNEQRTGQTSNELGVFGRYLTVWVVLCIAAGIVPGKVAPGVARYLDSLAIYSNGAPVVSIPIAVCLFFMMFPITAKIDFAEVIRTGRNVKPVGLTLIINWAIKPFTMYGIAFFFSVSFSTHSSAPKRWIS